MHSFTKLHPFCTAPAVATRTRARCCSSITPSDSGLSSGSILPSSSCLHSGGEEIWLSTPPHFRHHLVCLDCVYTLEIIVRTLREVVNRERLCGTCAFYFGGFRNLWGSLTPCRSTDTIYLCLGCWILRWCGDAEMGRGRRPVLY